MLVLAYSGGPDRLKNESLTFPSELHTGRTINATIKKRDKIITGFLPFSYKSISAYSVLLFHMIAPLFSAIEKFKIVQ